LFFRITIIQKNIQFTLQNLKS